MVLIKILPITVLLTLSIGCGSSDNNEVVAADPATGDMNDPTDNPPQTPLQTPRFLGELPITETIVVDLDPIVEAIGLDHSASSLVSADGNSILVDAENDVGEVRGIISIDIATGEPRWLFSDLSTSTRILFNANNEPKAVFAIACEPVDYTSDSELSMIDLTSLLPSDRCFSVRNRSSADGNVIIFSSYLRGDGTPFLSDSARLHAYTLETASLVDFPDLALTVDGIALSAKAGPSYMLREGSLSNDGSQWFVKQWWEGTDSNGDLIRHTGSVLWDTSSGEWQAAGFTPDVRNCVDTSRVSCEPPYDYLMSADGSTQYIHVPLAEEFDNGEGSLAVYQTRVEKLNGDASNGVQLAGLENVNLMAVNGDGSRVVRRGQTGDELARRGYAIYDTTTGNSVSLNRALQACALTDEQGIAIDAADCEFSAIPSSITNDPIAFSSDGSTLLLRSIARRSAEFDQEVDGFLHDLDTGATYTIPNNFSSDPKTLSGDGSILIGNSNFPDYDVIIGKR